MSGTLAGKHALITGGGSGVGFAIARAFVARGARVFLVGRTADKLERARAVLGDAGTLAVDLTGMDGPAQALDAAYASLGSLDVLVNCAGTFLWKRYLDLHEADWADTIATNLGIAHRMTLGLAKRWTEAEQTGAVINIASIHGTVADGNVVPQCAAKLGLVGLTGATAEALRGHGIRVNSISPGAVAPDTADTLSRDLTSKVTQGDIARIAVFLASDDAVGITGTDVPAYGITRPVVGGS